VAACLTERMGLDAREQRNVYYATLLRSVRCTSASHEIAASFGDDIEAEHRSFAAAALCYQPAGFYS